MPGAVQFESSRFDPLDLSTEPRMMMQLNTRPMWKHARARLRPLKQACRLGSSGKLYAATVDGF